LPALSTRSPFIALLVILMSAGILAAQGDSPAARVAGRVTDLDDRPVASARVTLVRSLEPASTKSVVTDAQGRWALVEVSTGRWEITVKARGFRTSVGWIDASRTGAGPVSVALRPLDEVTPIFGTSPQSITNWIEMGNDLLEQGHPERARQEYEKALTMLPLESQPEVLRAVARAHYLQQHWDQSVEALEQALRLAPDDATNRQLYRSLAIQLNRLEQAEAFLSSLDQGQVAGLGPAPREPKADPLAHDTRRDELPVEPPAAGRSGRFRVAFDQSSPQGGLPLLVERLGIDQAYVEENDPAGGRYDLRDESFQVYVPEGAPPAAGFGLLVWISPLPYGGFARDELREVLDRKGLIWVGADNSGNLRPLWHRVLLALDAVHNMQRHYRIDTDRVYAAGYSGGGRVTSTLVLLYSEVFRGGFSLFGCDYWQPVAIPHMPGAHWPAAFPAPSREIARRVKQSTRVVLLTGELDFNRSQTRAIFDQMIDDGFENVEMLMIPGASHYHPVENEWFAQGIAFLDQSDEGRVGVAERESRFFRDRIRPEPGGML
jgi:hypothetical protein